MHTPKRGRYGFFVWKMKHGVRRQLPTADWIDYLVLINCIWITTASEQYHFLGNGTMDECNASNWFGWKVIEDESFQWHFFVFGFVHEIRDWRKCVTTIWSLLLGSFSGSSIILNIQIRKIYLVCMVDLITNLKNPFWVHRVDTWRVRQSELNSSSLHRRRRLFKSRIDCFAPLIQPSIHPFQTHIKSHKIIIIIKIDKCSSNSSSSSMWVNVIFNVCIVHKSKRTTHHRIIIYMNCAQFDTFRDTFN